MFKLCLYMKKNVTVISYCNTVSYKILPNKKLLCMFKLYVKLQGREKGLDSGKHKSTPGRKSYVSSEFCLFS